MSKRIRVGIVGCGGIGQAHADALRQCKEAEITALCDVDKSRAAALAGEKGQIALFTDYRELLSADVVDAIVVCTPNKMHCPITLAAIAAGKDVLCEKPLAMNAREGKRMVDAAKAKKRILMVAQAMRYGSTAQYIQRLAEGGRFGEIYFGKVVWFRRAGIPRGWFQVRELSGGGPLIDLGVHAIDMLWWIMGKPKPIAAFGVASDRLGRKGVGLGTYASGYGAGKFDVEDLISATVQFEGGRTISLDITWAAHTEEMQMLRIFGDKAGAQILPTPVIYEAVDGIKSQLIPQLPEQSSFIVENRHFLDCIKTRREPISSGAQGLVIMTILDAIGASARTGKLTPIRTP
jgi:predicted dehydrogenase